MSRFYVQLFAAAREFFGETLRRDIVRAFRELQDAGCLEIIASAATHAFLPLLQDFPEAQRAQICIGCDSYREMFGREPGGFWLPECGYSNGLDVLLQEANLRWFVLDTHGLMFAQPRPQSRDLFAVLHAGGSGCLRPRSVNRIRRSGVRKAVIRATRLTAIFTAMWASIDRRKSCGRFSIRLECGNLPASSITA